MSEGRAYLAAAAFLMAAWQTAAWLAGPNVFATPAAAAARLVAEAGTQKLWLHMAASSFRVFAALAVSFVTAVPTGLFLGLSPRADRYARPLINLTYPVPKIVFLPVVLIIFGLGDLGKVAMLSIILFFQLLITTRDAARQVSRAARYSLYSLGGTKRHLFIHVIWPSCLPGVFTALRIATGTVVAVLFFVESIGTEYGMGFYIIDAWGRADIPGIFVGMTVLALMGVVLYEAFDVMERFFCKWKQI
ncbi:MAG: ABC transporter permease [Pseudomonadota bacterium]